MSGFGFRVLELGLRVWGLEFRGLCWGFRVKVSGFGFRVEGLVRFTTCGGFTTCAGIYMYISSGMYMCISHIHVYKPYIRI